MVHGSEEEWVTSIHPRLATGQQIHDLEFRGTNPETYRISPHVHVTAWNRELRHSHDECDEQSVAGLHSGYHNVIP